MGGPVCPVGVDAGSIYNDHAILGIIGSLGVNTEHAAADNTGSSVDARLLTRAYPSFSTESSALKCV